MRTMIIVGAALVAGTAIAAPARYEIDHGHGAFVDDPPTIPFVTIGSCGELTRAYLGKNVDPINAIVIGTKETVIAIEVGTSRHLIVAARTVDGRDKKGNGKLYGFWDWSDSLTISAVVELPKGEVTIAMMRHGTTVIDRFEKACVDRWRAPLRRAE